MRDHLDTTRVQSPLRKAEDAYLLDNTYMTVEEQISFVINLASSKMIQDRVPHTSG